MLAVLDMELSLVLEKPAPRAPGEQKLGDLDELAPLVGCEQQAL